VNVALSAAPSQRFGPYLLLNRIAVGGMAEIYLAKTQGLAGFEKLCALKVIHPDFASDQHFIQMLIDEAKIAVGLNHSNIAKIYELGRHNDAYYIAMEYVDGADLFRIMRSLSSKRVSVPLDVAAYIAQEICTGLDYAHTRQDDRGDPQSVIHRDISPQNILISRAGEIKIVDFGIAKAATRSRRTQTGVIKGKYFYMSPEQAWGDPVDHRTDIFSAGIILYEILTGRMLYIEEDLHKLLHMARQAEIATPSTRRPDIPPSLEHIVMKALARDPDQRWGTAREFQAALTSFLFSYAPDFTPQRLAQLVKLALEPPRRGNEPRQRPSQKEWSLAKPGAPISAFEDSSAARTQLDQADEATQVSAAPPAPPQRHKPSDRPPGSVARDRQVNAVAGRRPPPAAPLKHGHPSRPLGIRSTAEETPETPSTLGTWETLEDADPTVIDDAYAKQAMMDWAQQAQDESDSTDDEGKPADLATTIPLAGRAPSQASPTASKQDDLLPANTPAGELPTPPYVRSTAQAMYRQHASVARQPPAAHTAPWSHDTPPVMPAGDKGVAAAPSRSGSQTHAPGGDRRPNIFAMVALAIGSFALMVGVGAYFWPLKSAKVTLELISVPPGAKVSINGRSVGKVTPVVVVVRDPDRPQRIELSLRNFKIWNSVTSFAPGETHKKVIASLLARHGTLVINSDPPGAEVFLDHRWSGRTPLELGQLPLDRQLTLTLKKRGFGDVTRTVMWTDQTWQKITVTLQRLRSPRPPPNTGPP